jgi:hypothetical protein
MTVLLDVRLESGFADRFHGVVDEVVFHRRRLVVLRSHSAMRAAISLAVLKPDFLRFQALKTAPDAQSNLAFANASRAGGGSWS